MNRIEFVQCEPTVSQEELHRQQTAKRLDELKGMLLRIGPRALDYYEAVDEAIQLLRNR